MRERVSDRLYKASPQFQTHRDRMVALEALARVDAELRRQMTAAATPERR